MSRWSGIGRWGRADRLQRCLVVKNKTKKPQAFVTKWKESLKKRKMKKGGPGPQNSQALWSYI